jgi:cadmium resistance protein CadD (predicted permease)
MDFRMIVIVMAFVLTNIDGFSCLAAEAAVSSPARWLRASAEASVAFALLVIACLIASFAVDTISAGNVAWLGIVPAAIGLGKVITAFGKQTANARSASIAAIVFATGMDNVAMYVPLFALLGALRASGVGLIYALVFGVIATAIMFVAPNVAHLARYRRFVDVSLGVFFIAVGVEIIRHGVS